MSGISPTTARLAHQALRRQWVGAEARRNGVELTPDLVSMVRAALEELEAAARSDDTSGFVGATGGVPVVVRLPRSELIDVAEASRRLWVSRQAVRKRLAAGTLPGRKVGPVWLVEWRPDGEQGLGAVRGGDQVGSLVSAPGAG